MRKILQHALRRMSAGRRPGSIMIMVVALLVLLALMGTAWIAVTYSDREVSQVHKDNSQADLIIQAMRGTAEDTVVRDQMGHPAVAQGARRDPLSYMRPRSDSLRTYTYQNWDSPYPDVSVTASGFDPLDAAELQQGKSWLASRVPLLYYLDPNKPPFVYWPAVSAPLIPEAQRLAPGLLNEALDRFESPLNTGGRTLYRERIGLVRPTDSNSGYVIEPTGVTIGYPDGTARSFPAFRHTVLLPGGRGTGPTTIFLAADTDGDGIADAGLWRLPIATQNGISWFAAFRIIDNNSALNASVAWEPYRVINESRPGDLPANLYPTNINLYELLEGNLLIPDPTKPAALDPLKDQQMVLLNQHRFHFETGRRPPFTHLYPLRDDLPNHAPWPNAPPDRFPPIFMSTGAIPAMSGRPPEAPHSYEALWVMLGMRMDNPGYNWGEDYNGVTGPQKYRALSLSDQISLAHRFVILNPSPSVLENALYPTLVRRRDRNNQFFEVHSPYSPYDVGNPTSRTGWYFWNFDYDPPNLPQIYSRRPLMVVRNAVSNQIQEASMTGPAAAGQPGLPNGVVPVPPPPANPSAVLPYGPAPCKNNPNTASFEELFRAYWSVMADRTNPGPGVPTPPDFDTTPFWRDVSAYEQQNQNDPAKRYDLYNLANPARMFRSIVRDPRKPDQTLKPYRLAPAEVLRIRAAMAALNTVQLRNGDFATATAPYATMQMPVRLWSDKAQPETATATLYPVRPQVYITEVYVNVDTTTAAGNDPKITNPRGYWAIELHNPHNFEINLNGWRLSKVDRRGASGWNYPLAVTDIVTFDSTVPASIPAGGYIVLENYSANSGGTAQYRPPTAGTPAGTVVYVKDLDKAEDGELVLSRPANPTVTPKVAANQLSRDLVPVDQFDFTNLKVPAAGGTATAWHYVRANAGLGAWKFVYAGRYTAFPTSATGPRLKNVDTATWDPAGDPPGADPWKDNKAPTTIALGSGEATGTLDNGKEYPFQIQLANTDWPSPVVPTTGGYNRGFLRNGDILQAPFIGAYVITLSNGGLIEANAVTTDAVLAEDCDSSDDDREAVGRFCPVTPVAPKDWDQADRQGIPLWDKATGADDWSMDPTRWRYHWAMRLFDYLSVQTPHEDYLPNMPRESLEAYYTKLFGPDPRNWPAGVVNADKPANSIWERTIGVEGKININTAPWPVLATLPMIRMNSISATYLMNRDLARAIAAYRDGGGGPFKNIYDLYRVPEFRKAAMMNCVILDKNNPLIGEPDDLEGDFTPYNRNSNGASPTQIDRVRGDWEEQFLLLNRISNMITTRSDTFTCYILVQGWRNAGTAQPELVSQRRVGLIIDRTGVHFDPGSVRVRRDVKTVAFPSD